MKIMEIMWDALQKDEIYTIFYRKEYIGKFIEYKYNYAVFMVDSNKMNIKIDPYDMPLFYKIC
jgi:hypothetical protein